MTGGVQYPLHRAALILLCERGEEVHSVPGGVAPIKIGGKLVHKKELELKLAARN